jgi:hypothetical protein
VSNAARTTDKWKDIGWIKLTPGKFSIEVINISGQLELKVIQTKIGLYWPRGK